jgi:chemotaxis signal transduction protein
MIRHSACDKYCVFVSGSGWYAVPALAVREVAPCPDLFRVPAADVSLAGICHLRNEFLAIVRLDLLQAHEAQANHDPQQLLVLTANAGAWGLLVDKVVALESMEFSIRTELDREDGHLDLQIGAATYHDHFVRLLDPHHLYRYAELRLRNAWVSRPEPAAGVQAKETVSAESGDKL